MFAYLAAIEFLFDDADLPDVDASRLYRDRADEAKSECKDGAAAAAADDDDVEDVEAYADVARGLKYFCAIGDNERIECEVVIGTYFDFSEADAVEEVESIEPVAAVFILDDKDFSVSSLASFKSFSASTSMFTDEGEALVEAIGFVSTSPSNSSPFTVFPDFKEDFKSSKDGSSSTRASSAVFTAEERSPLEEPEEDEAAELAACELLLFAEKYASSASLFEIILSSLFLVPDILLVFDAPSSSFFRAAENSTFVFASSAVSASSFDDFFSSDDFFSDDDDAFLFASLSKLKYPSSFFIVSSVSRSSLALSSSPSRESDSIVVDPNFPSPALTLTAGAFGGTKTSPSLL
jgi:hypothetical protein